MKNEELRNEGGNEGCDKDVYDEARNLDVYEKVGIGSYEKH
ncbi:hypothetical protein [Paenibacillus sp. Root444D2]|nr:hypothetical protein [Paenibacillus sp. Root444D2]